MTMLGKEAWNKGKKMPHTPEWEEKRIAAVREAAKTRVYKKGYKRLAEHIDPMRKAATKWRQENKERCEEIAIANLPKDCYGEKNGNWRGGKTKAQRDFYTANASRMRRWRKSVLERDGYTCKKCGATEKLQAHHIVPLVQTTAFAFDRANGVTLCLTCHKETDSYASKARNIERIGKSIQIITIPHEWQDYSTVGNWRIGDDDSLVIFVSDMGNEDYAFLVALHELVEVWLCKKRGITEKQVDEFDMSYAGQGQPGDDPAAPYFHEHQFATKIEMLMCEEMGIDFKTYDQACDLLGMEVLNGN